MPDGFLIGSPRRGGNLRRTCAVLGTAVAVTAALSGPAAASAARGAPARAHPAGVRMAQYSAAAKEYGVPASVLLAIGYNESRWEPHGSMPSADGGYGLMNLTAKTFSAVSGRTGKPVQQSLVKTHYTLAEAARLLHVPAATLKSDNAENIRGAAAVLARYARALDDGRLPATVGGWYGAVAEFSGDTQQRTAELFADDVFATVRSGASLVTSDGQAMRLAASPATRPDRGLISKLGLKAAPKSSVPVDCPADLNCTFTPAAYAEDPGNNPENYGDYDIATRPRDLKINSIVIHDTEESYADTIATFENPASYVSANYVIQSSTGDITEMVRPQDVAWAVGNWYYNTHSISIEHEGFAAQGSVWYTQTMYKASAELVKYLAHRFGIPLSREYIVGHDNVVGPTTGLTAIQHWDPGPFWNWQYYMGLLHGKPAGAELSSAGTATPDGQHVVVIDPNWATNEPPVTDCQTGTCVKLPKQPASFVYLHTQPSFASPLLSDPTLHPSGTPGTHEDNDWGDKAPYGEKYVVAGQHGHWTGIWYGGGVGWFYNPPGSGQTGRYTSSLVITPKPGVSSIPVYGSAFPEASAYPKVVPVQPNAPLVYTIPAGQQYVVTGAVPDDYYYAVTFDSSMPDDHTVIRGKTLYYQIIYNHRLCYVKAADVVVSYLR
ncbi:MAG TPA: N-acetylmuramoyl-L-alanine amidase [Streptosporangiaceae bacterium]|nr:N-acetylmuramoyl-L-alanine amidase [Streptosporangiaceae bacterium]